MIVRFPGSGPTGIQAATSFFNRVTSYRKHKFHTLKDVLQRLAEQPAKPSGDSPVKAMISFNLPMLSQVLDSEHIWARQYVVCLEQSPAMLATAEYAVGRHIALFALACEPVAVHESLRSAASALRQQAASSTLHAALHEEVEARCYAELASKLEQAYITKLDRPPPSRFVANAMVAVPEHLHRHHGRQTPESYIAQIVENKMPGAAPILNAPERLLDEARIAHASASLGSMRLGSIMQNGRTINISRRRFFQPLASRRVQVAPD